MILDETKGYPSANGCEVTKDMIEAWDAAYTAGSLPEGYAFDGPIMSGRPRLFEGEMATMTVRIPRAQKEALERDAERRGMSFSGYVREVLAVRAS